MTKAVTFVNEILYLKIKILSGLVAHHWSVSLLVLALLVKPQTTLCKIT